LVPMGIYPDSLTAGVDYWEKHVCKKENSYVFYEQIHMLRYPDLHDKMHRWFEKIDNTIKISPKIKDPQFKKAMVSIIVSWICCQTFTTPEQEWLFDASG